MVYLLKLNNKVKYNILDNELPYYLREVVNIYDRKGQKRLDFKELMNLCVDGQNFNKLSHKLEAPTYLTE